VTGRDWAALDEGHLEGVRVRVLVWHTITVPIGGTIGMDGLIRDKYGAVISVDDNVTVPPLTEGTVVGEPDGTGQVPVQWDNGSRLSLGSDDKWEVVA
jgi:hypothetical protein